MSDGIYYNQEVTADTLNEIAVDLGATSFNGFGVNKFGADELNKITAELVGRGVLLSGDMCRPTIMGEELYISKGIIVFSNGAKKTLTEAVKVPLTANTCIYALNDVAAGVCSIVTATDFPSAGDYVKLAAVDSLLNVTDEREISKAKVCLLAGNAEKEYSFDTTFGIIEKGIMNIPVSEWDCFDKLTIESLYGNNFTGFYFYKKSDIKFGEQILIGVSGNRPYIKFVAEGDAIKIYGRNHSGGGDDAIRTQATITLF